MRVRFTILKETKGAPMKFIKIPMPTSWKTTLTSLVSAAGMYVSFAQGNGYVHFPPWVMSLAIFAQIGGLAAFGIAAKDSGVTGGTIGQPSTTEALQVANQAPSVANPPSEAK